MRLRTLYENLMRIILLMISVQFFSLAINPGESSAASTKNDQTLKAEHSRSLSLSVFFEEKSGKEGENKSEENREKIAHSVELTGLSVFENVLATFVHSTSNKTLAIGKLFSAHPPLFKLNHLYLI
jgi:hypothetical protein